MNDVYRDELRLLGLGYPLYEPGPTGGYDRVRIGDVGIITKEGAFQPVFNVFCNKDDPVNTKFGVPEGLIVSDKKYAEARHYSGIDRGSTLKSEHIQSIEFSGSFQMQE